MSNQYDITVWFSKVLDEPQINHKVNLFPAEEGRKIKPNLISFRNERDRILVFVTIKLTIKTTLVQINLKIIRNVSIWLRMVKTEKLYKKSISRSQIKKLQTKIQMTTLQTRLIEIYILCKKKKTNKMGIKVIIPSTRSLKLTMLTNQSTLPQWNPWKQCITLKNYFQQTILHKTLIINSLNLKKK